MLNLMCILSAAWTFTAADEIIKAAQPKNQIIKNIWKKHDIKWLRLSVSYHRFLNLSEILYRDFQRKISERVASIYFTMSPCNYPNDYGYGNSEAYLSGLEAVIKRNMNSTSSARDLSTLLTPVFGFSAQRIAGE